MTTPRADNAASWAFFAPGSQIRCWCNRRLFDLGAGIEAAVRPSTGLDPLPGTVTHKCKRCDTVLEIRFGTQKAA